MDLFDLTKSIYHTATQPIRDVSEILEGLSEGELRERAAARLGWEAVVGMSVEELIDVLKSDS